VRLVHWIHSKIFKSRYIQIIDGALQWIRPFGKAFCFPSFQRIKASWNTTEFVRLSRSTLLRFEVKCLQLRDRIRCSSAKFDDWTSQSDSGLCSKVINTMFENEERRESLELWCHFKKVQSVRSESSGAPRQKSVTKAFKQCGNIMPSWKVQDWHPGRLWVISAIHPESLRVWAVWASCWGLHLHQVQVHECLLEGKLRASSSNESW